MPDNDQRKTFEALDRAVRRYRNGMSRTWLSIASVVSMLLLLCTLGPLEHAGNTSDDEASTTSETVALVYGPTGNPVAGARARFISIDHSPAPEAGSAGKIDSAFSNDAGIVRLADVTFGTYNIEYEQHGKVARRDSVAIDAALLAQGDTLRDTLRAPGGLRGVVRLQPYHDARKVLIVLFGTDRVIAPYDSAGNFVIQGMAAGSYDANVMALYEHYGVLPASFTVRTGTIDTLTDTLVLPFLGLAPVKGLKASYDTAWQVTNLSWHADSTTRATGFRVYRGGAAAPATLLTPHPVTDTSYADTLWFSDTLIQGAPYEYRVRAVDAAGGEGPPSPGVTVKAVALFDSAGVIADGVTPEGCFANAGGMAMGPDSMVYICDPSAHQVRVFDRRGTFRFAFGNTGATHSRLSMPVDIAVGDDGSVFVAEYYGHRIHAFTASGEHVAVFGSEGPGDEQFYRPRAITADNRGRLYVLDEGNRRVAVWTVEGIALELLAPARADVLARPEGMAMCAHGQLFVTDAAQGTLFALDLARQTFEPFAEGLGSPAAVGCDPSGGHVYVVIKPAGYIVGIGVDGRRSCRWQATGSEALSLLPMDIDEIWVGTETHVIRFRRRK